MLPIKRAHNFGTCFVTTNCASKRSIFQVEKNAALLMDVLQHYRSHYKLHAFVLMPNHFHLLLTPQSTTLERCLQLVKGGFSRRYHLELGGLRDVWQKGFADHRIRDRAEYDAYLEYIAQNPVKAGLVSSPNEYAWSSFRRIQQRRTSPSAAEAALREKCNGMAEAMTLRKQFALRAKR